MADPKDRDPIADYIRGTPNDSAPRCQRRVWDNGDQTECGEPASHLGFCEDHLMEVASCLRTEVLETRRRLATLEKRLADLQVSGTENGSGARR